MKNMSFALTTQQVRNQTKDVTRRIGWLFLEPGHLLQPVVKGMGLKRGQRMERIGDPVRVISMCSERLRLMTDDLQYGRQECKREGFPDMTPAEFVAMFCASHRGCTPQSIVTRIEFSYEV